MRYVDRLCRWFNPSTPKARVEAETETGVVHPIDLPNTSPTYESVEEREYRIEQNTLAKMKGMESWQ